MTVLGDPPPGLPASVLRHAVLKPPENLVLEIVREQMPDVPSRIGIPGEEGLWPHELSAVPGQQRAAAPLLILIRRAPGYGVWAGSPRGVDACGISVQVFAHGADAEERALWTGEAVRAVLAEAQYEQRVYEGLGALTSCWLEMEGQPKADWATASGPVQYADLPEIWCRTEARFQVMVRRPRR